MVLSTRAESPSPPGGPAWCSTQHALELATEVRVHETAEERRVAADQKAPSLDGCELSIGSDEEALRQVAIVDLERLRQLTVLVAHRRIGHPEPAREAHGGSG